VEDAGYAGDASFGDGERWTPLGTATINMPSSILLGMAVG